MNPLTRWLRIAAAAVAVLALALTATATAGAAVKRSADVSSYTSDRYLRHALGLPQKDDYAIESVTYDRFQWLLQQPGKFAYLIGDPATDSTFRARAQAVEAAAYGAGVKRVYWFNPNLSGNAKIGPITEPNLDIRKPTGIGSLGADSQKIYDRAWVHLVARHLGNGVRSDFGTGSNQGENQSGARTSWTADATVVNDYGATATYSTKVGDTSGGALYDYSGYTGTNAPANAQDSVFFLYDKDGTVTPQGESTARKRKILAWVNLTDSPTAAADVATAIAAGGAASITEIDEFQWWKSANNAKQVAQAGQEYQGALHPNLTDADGAEANGGWRVHQVTFPELVYVLSTENDKEAVILLGGTWCPNTRPVLPAINRHARENDVDVINFDTILDGSIVGGGNSSANPLQTRNPHLANSVINANPSFVFGDFVTHYLSNLKTENKPDADNKITFFPGGDTTKTPTSQPRLQVPYLFGYKGAEGDAPHGGITRQWIHDTGVNDAQGRRNYVEYMSSWHYTNPKQGQLGISPAALPRELALWSTINAQLASFTWQTDPEPLKYNTADYSDVSKFVLESEKATVTYVPPGERAATIATAISTAPEAISINAAAAAAAVTALGGNAPATYTQARTRLLAEYAKPEAERDATLIGHLSTLVGSWGFTESRKTTVNNTWGSVTRPNSVKGGLTALRAAEEFFAGLPDVPGDPGPSDPGPGTSTNTPPAAPTPVPPAPPAGSPIRSTTVAKIAVRKLAGSVAKAPTSKRSGRYTVKVTVPDGKAKATGKVTLTLKKGSQSKKVTGTLKNGEVTIAVPKLAKGTWKVTIAWPGDATYRSVTATGTVKVKR